LSSPSVRRKCPNCNRTEEVGDHCPMLYGSGDQLRIYCVPIRRLDQELGIFHLFLPSDARIEGEQEYILRLISDQTALALEGARLRSREENAHFQLESVKRHLDVGFFIEELLKGLVRGLEIQVAVVSVWENQLKQPIKEFAVGELSEAQKALFFSLLNRRSLAKFERVRNTLPFGVEGEHANISVITVPIPIEKRDLRGALQLLLPSTKELTEKQEEMLKAIVTQISFLLQNANLLAEVEIKAILQERIRLAREIHDGLAQTLGFLKLKMSQLRAYLEQGELERANQTTQLLHEAISDAYMEARHAIDQLRISIYDAPLAELLQETLAEFCESSGIPGETIVEPQELRLPVEINAQLVRIVQESLSNVRKHARAHHVQIQAAIKGDWLILEVRDDGVGFQPEEVSRHSQYGLRGMQERAEQIGAELQIISQPNEGATVQVRLPLSQLERSWQT
ncbi:MAG: sensor histidine kinase, partial [Anaerolineales bacterium]|nr:sensor histidine kinase [Anaerolineales bacterium]